MSNDSNKPIDYFIADEADMTAPSAVTAGSAALCDTTPTQAKSRTAVPS
jgi:hypothetical protein